MACVSATVWVCAPARHKQWEESVLLAPQAISVSPSVLKTVVRHVSALEDLGNAHKPSIHGHR